MFQASGLRTQTMVIHMRVQRLNHPATCWLLHLILLELTNISVPQFYQFLKQDHFIYYFRNFTSPEGMCVCACGGRRGERGTPQWGWSFGNLFFSSPSGPGHTDSHLTCGLGPRLAGWGPVPLASGLWSLANPLTIHHSQWLGEAEMRPAEFIDHGWHGGHAP